MAKDGVELELLNRELARRGVMAFGKYVFPKFEAYRHQSFIAERLGGILRFVESKGRKGVGRLMVLMPPQHGKSLLSAVLFPAWALGRMPNLRFIMVSYNAKRAEKNSKAVRDLIETPMYKAVFGNLTGRDDPVELSVDARGMAAWSLEKPNNGGMISAGVGGSVTGYDANIIIIDDPFAGRADAENPNEREKVVEWYESQIYSRQQAGTAIILFHTRWHADDLAGSRIKEMASNPQADRWEIVNLPAIALDEGDYPVSKAEQLRLMGEGIYLPFEDQLMRQAGEELCPELLNIELLRHIRENISEYNFASLYQQMPFERSGAFFKREWFDRRVNEVTEEVGLREAVWYWDNGATSGGGDYSAGVLMGMDARRRVWVLVVVRGQWSTFERQQKMREAWEAARERFVEVCPTAAVWHPQDPGSAGLDSARATNIALAPIPAHFEPVTGSKELRADPWRSALEGGNVVFLNGDWVQDFVEEHTRFPKGKYDDQVDAAASAYAKLIGNWREHCRTNPVYVEGY